MPPPAAPASGPVCSGMLNCIIEERDGNLITKRKKTARCTLQDIVSTAPVSEERSDQAPARLAEQGRQRQSRHRHRPLVREEEPRKGTERADAGQRVAQAKEEEQREGTTNRGSGDC